VTFRDPETWTEFADKLVSTSRLSISAWPTESEGVVTDDAAWTVEAFTISLQLISSTIYQKTYNTMVDIRADNGPSTVTSAVILNKSALIVIT